jgi:hypothetical protein
MTHPFPRGIRGWHHPHMDPEEPATYKPMDPDETLAKFWTALEERRIAILSGDAEAEFRAADEAVEQAHNLFSWLADGRPAPNWTWPR